MEPQNPPEQENQDSPAQPAQTNSQPPSEWENPLVPFPQDKKKPVAKKRRKVTVKKKRDGSTVLVSKSKMDLFLEEYLATNGNGAEAAMRVFNTNRANASVIAREYLKRAQGLGRIILEKKGMAYGDLIDMAKKRMENERSADFVPLFDRMMKIGGFEDFLSKGPVTKATVNVMTVQKGILDEYVQGEFVEDEENEK